MAKMFLKFLVLLWSTTLIGCALNASVLKALEGSESSPSTEVPVTPEAPPAGGDTPPVIAAPTSTSLVTPSASPSVIATPTFRVPNVTNGDLVKLFADAICANEIGSGTALANTIDISVSTLAVGSHQVRAKIQRSGVTSNCSDVLFTYEVTAAAMCSTYSASALGSVTNVRTSSVAGQAVYALGNYAYMGTSAGANTGIQIVDVSNPASPTNVSYIDTFTGMGQIDASGNDIFDIVVNNNTLYASTYSGGLLIVDVTNKAVPVITSTLNLAGETWGIAYKDNYVYVGSSTAGLYVVDVTNPNSPILVNTFATMPLRHIQIEGNRIYGAASTKIQVIDISTVSAPALLGELTVGLHTAYETYYKNGYLYALEKSLRNLLTYDVSNPAAITLVNTLAVPGGMDPRTIDGVEDKIFVGTGSGSTGEVRTYSIATPATPTHLGSVAATNRTYEIDYYNGRVYSANLDGKLQVFQVCPP